jgi:hypothetical protein
MKQITKGYRGVVAIAEDGKMHLRQGEYINLVAIGRGNRKSQLKFSFLSEIGSSEKQNRLMERK